MIKIIRIYLQNIESVMSVYMDYMYFMYRNNDKYSSFCFIKLHHLYY